MDNFSRTLSAALLGCSLTLVSGCDSSEQGSSDTGQALEDNQAPIALAGTTQYVKVGQPVTLNGVQSFDKEGDLLQYQWQLVAKPDSSQASLEDPNQAIAFFTPDIHGQYIAELVVNDGNRDSRPNQVKVEVSRAGANLPPVIKRLRNHMRGDLVGDVAQSYEVEDPDGDEVLYHAELLSKPEGSNPEYYMTSWLFGLVPEIEGFYEFKLSFTDGYHVVTSNVTVETYYENLPPEADSGELHFSFLGNTAIADGSKSSDPNNDPLTYSWRFVSKPIGSQVEFDDPTAVKTSFVPDKAGDYVYEVVVSDGEFESVSRKGGYRILGDNAPQLRMYKDDETQPLSLPHRRREALDFTDQPVQDRYSLGKYRLKAVGGDVTISDISSNIEGDFQPYFVGLNFDEVVVLPKGQEIEIEVFSPRTFGETEQLSLWFFWSMHGLNHYTQFEMFGITGSIVTP